MEVTLMEMLEARESRAMKQMVLLKEYGKPLVSFSMNIAGPVKDTKLTRQGYDIGRERLDGLLKVEKIKILSFEECRANTGSEALYVLDADAKRIKSLTTQIEELDELGRLFDMDVISPTGEKLERPSPRRCLICGGPAQVCARSRTHTVPELQKKTNEILSAAIVKADSERASEYAIRALLYEVGVTPKPGLVDRKNSGSHSDMDFYTFQRSAAALFPYFQDCVRQGRANPEESPVDTLNRLRFIGKIAEGDMLRATGGVNTHKGAIFSLGILCGALGRLDRSQWNDAERVLREVAAMCEHVVSGDYRALKAESAHTSGETQFLQYGITGVRGQAQAGFPEVLQIGLPKLEDGLRRGLSFDRAATGVLLSYLSTTTDTNMIHRGGKEIQEQEAQQIQRLLAEDPFPQEQVLTEVDRRYIEKNLSPGGCADLLAITLFLHFLKEETNV